METSVGIAWFKLFDPDETMDGGIGRDGGGGGIPELFTDSFPGYLLIFLYWFSDMTFPCSAPLPCPENKITGYYFEVIWQQIRFLNKTNFFHLFKQQSSITFF